MMRMIQIRLKPPSYQKLWRFPKDVPWSLILFEFLYCFVSFIGNVRSMQVLDGLNGLAQG
jgi:hypothetical protein